MTMLLAPSNAEPRTMIGRAADIVAAADALRAHPITRVVLLGLAGEVPEMTALAAMPELDRINELTLKGESPTWRKIPPASGALAALAKCRSLGALRKLTLETNLLDDSGASALAHAPFFASVEELVIMDNPAIGEGGLAPLFRRLSALRRLYVRATSIGPTSARALAGVAVRELQLDTCGLHDEGARRLFESAALDETERLVITGDLLRASVGAFGRSSHGRSLRALELPRCSVEDAGVVALAGGHAFERLTYLDLSHVLLGNDAAIALASSKAFPMLEKLDLRGNDIEEAGANALGSATGLPALGLLGLSDNRLLTGKTSLHEWGGGMWEAGGVVVEEKLDADAIGQRFVRRPGVRVF
ncbi:MAG: hypothetical protein ACXVEF_30920 [Polyangiales bacterium]